MGKQKVKLPECGILLGSGVYPMSGDFLLGTLHAHQAWTPQSFYPMEMIEKVLKDNQGNLAQVWGYARGSSPAVIAAWKYALDEIGVNIPEPDWEKGTNILLDECEELKKHADRYGAGTARFIREAAAKGIYTALIYVDSNDEWIKHFHDVGEYYLGYDFGERFTFSFKNAVTEGKKPSEITLKMLADDLVARVKAHVDERHAKGWGNVMATSSNFYIDYEVLAGTDIPVVEDFAFCHLNLASALSRGLYRQYELPIWGSHLAHEHYAWIPQKSGLRYALLRASMYQKYMAGSKMIINESGNWFVEASLCEDSPKFTFPRVPLKPADVPWRAKNPIKFIPYQEEARKHYPSIGYDSPWCRGYRKEISDFYDFVKENGTPEGQPESTIAIAKGNLDLSHARYMPNYAIAGASELADINPQWYEGVPERGWEIVRNVFYPLLPVLDNYPNHFLSGSPHGMVDVVSFAQEKISAEFLSANYKAIIFSGWNSSSEEQYEVLRQYVFNGGKLFISIPHLSKNNTRNYGSYTVDELVNGGDFSELCGVKVKGKGGRFYWATLPDDNSELGVKFPRRFGIMAVSMGEIEITDPAMRTLVVDDEQAKPLLLHRKYGKGEVFFLNSWAYPGALEHDDGPGATLEAKAKGGLIGLIFQHIAKLSRGNVWITDDQVSPGSECDYITFSYFPEAGKICLFNVDFRNGHSFYLHQFGLCGRIELGASEFRMIETTKLKPSKA
ncbi:MAG: hypothetical protein A2X49_09525 [Lentisphaerae bacterium GWF2_52_8]|nr:MAG: hypothetical protein A2X49_09525 [Lentisphaerae bacterium GWF2_52_8]